MTNQITQEDIKLQNRRKILTHFRTVREATRQEISAATGISIPTVASNISELLEEGILEEAGRRDSTGGRKPLALRFLPKSRHTLGVDLEPREGRIVAVDLDHRVTAEHRFRFSPDQPELFSRLEEEIGLLLRETGTTKAGIDGIGFALPGTVDPEQKILEVAPNLGIRSLDFSLLEQRLGLNVKLFNEANAAVWAEWLAEGADSGGTMIYLSISEGVGGGILINGRLFLGSGAMAGELGHMVTVPGGRACNCGQKGCWERYVSQAALLSEEGRAAFGLEEFFEKLGSGDREFRLRWDRYIMNLTAGIRNLIVIFDPDTIVIGGAIANYGGLLLPPLRDAVHAGGSSIMDRGVSIRTARLAEDAPILGAAVLSFSDRNS
jgi:predicted NBD/HSP70 family sugar kinase